MSDRDAPPHFATLNRSLRVTRLAVIALGVTILLLSLGTIALAASGDLDLSFGSNGVVSPPFWVNALAVQPDGKIVVSGDDGQYTATGRVARYNPDGTLDLTFGDNGLVVTAAPLSAVKLQSNGKIIVAGRRALIRLDPTGSLDTSFGGSGIVATDTSINEITDVALTVNDQVIIFGRTTNSLAIARYTSAGDRDLSFNGTGEVDTGFAIYFLPGPNGTILPQPNGKLIAVGTGPAISIELIRYNADGSLDTSFGVNGHVITNSSHFAVNGALQQPDGKVVVWGILGPPPGAFWLARYDTQGNLDPTFGNGGISPSDAFSSGGWFGTLEAAILQSDGKIIVLETAGHLARFLPNGQLDSSFGTGGVVADSFVLARSLAIQRDTNLIVGGRNYLARRHLLGLMSFKQAVTSLSPDPGQLITYTFTLKNTEAVTITHVAISDILPAELRWAGPLGIQPQISATLGIPPALVRNLTLMPAQALTLTLPMTVNLGLANGTRITHTLTAGSDQTGLITSSLIITTSAPPVARSDLSLTAKNTPVVIQVLRNDTDANNDVISLVHVGTPLSGTASLLANAVIYTPTLNFVGTDVFTYTVTDGRFIATGAVNVVVAGQLFQVHIPVQWTIGDWPIQPLAPSGQYSTAHPNMTKRASGMP